MPHFSIWEHLGCRQRDEFLRTLLKARSRTKLKKHVPDVFASGIITGEAPRASWDFGPTPKGCAFGEVDQPLHAAASKLHA
jgi:hypothetical protein